MSAEVITTVAIGGAALLVALATYWSSRSEQHHKSERQLFADLIAPVLVRLGIIEGRLDDLESGRRRRD